MIYAKKNLIFAYIRGHTGRRTGIRLMRKAGVAEVASMHVAGHYTLKRHRDYDGPDARDMELAAAARKTKLPVVRK